MKAKWIISAVLLAFNALAIGQMHECRRQDGTRSLTNVPCKTGEKTISLSVDRVNYELLQRDVLKKHRVESENISHEKAERHRAERRRQATIRDFNGNSISATDAESLRRAANSIVENDRRNRR
jgi:hypothetical protein